MALPADLRVRVATPTDAEGIARLVVACDLTYSGWAPPARRLRAGGIERERRRAEALVADADRWTRVALDRDGRLVAVVSWGQAREPHPDGKPVPRLAHVSAVFVHPDRWREGIASVLLADALAAMAARGYERARLWAVEGAPACSFYEAEGWTDDGGRTVIPHLGLGAVRYVRALAA